MKHAFAIGLFSLFVLAACSGGSSSTTPRVEPTPQIIIPAIGASPSPSPMVISSSYALGNLVKEYLEIAHHYDLHAIGERGNSYNTVIDLQPGQDAVPHTTFFLDLTVSVDSARIISGTERFSYSYRDGMLGLSSIDGGLFGISQIISSTAFPETASFNMHGDVFSINSFSDTAKANQVENTNVVWFLTAGPQVSLQVTESGVLTGQFILHFNIEQGKLTLTDILFIEANATRFVFLR